MVVTYTQHNCDYLAVYLNDCGKRVNPSSIRRFLPMLGCI